MYLNVVTARATACWRVHAGARCVYGLRDAGVEETVLCLIKVVPHGAQNRAGCSFVILGISAAASYV